MSDFFDEEKISDLEHERDLLKRKSDAQSKLIDEMNNADRHDLRDATRQRKQLATALIELVDEESDWIEISDDALTLAREIIEAKGGA